MTDLAEARAGGSHGDRGRGLAIDHRLRGRHAEARRRALWVRRAGRERLARPGHREGAKMAEAQDAGGAGVASAGSGSERQRAHQHESVLQL